MVRLTKEKDKYECRVKNCTVEEWMREIYGKYPERDFCENCPVMYYANALAEYEDKEEY